VALGLRRPGRGSVAQETVWASGLEGLQLAIMLLSFTLLGKHLGPAGFAGYAAMYAIIGILGGVVYVGVTLSVVQHLVQDRQDLGKVLNSGLGIVLIAGLAGAALGTLVGDLTIPGLSLPVIASFMFAELMGAATIEVLASTVFARDGVAMAARYRVLPLLGRLTILLVLFGTGTLSIAHLGLAYLVMYPVVALGVAASVARRYGVVPRPARPSWSHVRTSGLYATTISAVSLQNDGDKVVMTASKIGPDAGLYAAAYRLVLMGMVPLRALLAATHRRFLEHDPDSRGQHVRRSLQFSAVGAVYGLVFGVCLYVAAPLVTVLLGGEYEGAATMLRLLAPVVAVRSFAEFGINGLLGFGRVALRTGVTVFAAGTALVLYVVLIPRFGWHGAVAGTYASELVLAVAAWSTLLVLQRRHDAALDRGEADPDADLPPDPQPDPQPGLQSDPLTAPALAGVHEPSRKAEA